MKREARESVKVARSGKVGRAGKGACSVQAAAPAPREEPPASTIRARPQGPREEGIHKAIWDEIEERPFALPPDKRLTLAAYVADVPIVAHVEPVGVEDLLRDMPAYLDADSYVPVPLEATYRTTWESCPEDMRAVVERGEPLPDESVE